LVLDLPAGLELADPGGEVKVLGGGVPLPFVLGGESAGAACESEYAGEGAGVGACGVALERFCIVKGGVIARLAGKLVFDLGDVLDSARALSGMRSGFGCSTLVGACGLGDVFGIRYLFSDENGLVNVTFSVAVGI
jgi:hypothetical protein